MFTEALFKIARMWSQCKCPSMDAQRKKMWDVYTKQYYSDLKRKKFCHSRKHG
jgi:hypothetical protein